MDKKDNNQGNNGNKTGGVAGAAGETLEKARSTIMRTLSAVISGFTDMSGGNSIPAQAPIPAPAPPTSTSVALQNPPNTTVTNSRGNNPTLDRLTDSKPKNIDQLLKVCAELSGSDPHGPSGDQNESVEERKKFLEEAIMSFGGARTVIDDLKDAIRRLSVGPSTDPETIIKQLGDLNFIAYHVDDLDLANDFIKVGGLPEIIKYLQSPDGQIRKETYNILAVTCQNNPFAWKFYENLNILPIILENLIQESYEEAVDYGFSAVSCLIRGNPNAILQLKGHSGEDLIYTVLLQSDRTKTLRKAGYILRSLMLYDKEQNGSFMEARDYYRAILQELSDRIRTRGSQRDTLGAVLQVIYYILSEHEELIGNYLKPEVGLVRFVEEILAIEPTDDDSLETMETYNAASDLKPLLNLE